MSELTLGQNSPATITPSDNQSFFAEPGGSMSASAFIQVPQVISASGRLTMNQKLALSFVLHCHRMGHPEWACVKKLVEYCHMASTTAYNAINFLVSAGLLAKERIEGVHPKVFRPINAALELLKTLCGGARKGVRKVAKKVRETSHAAQAAAHSLTTGLKGHKQLEKLIGMSIKHVSQGDMANVEEAWRSATKHFEPDEIVRAYETYAVRFSCEDVMYAKKLEKWLSDERVIGTLLEGRIRPQACHFSAINQQTRSIKLSSKAVFYPDVKAALEEHKRAWEWLPAARKATGYAGKDDVSGLLKLAAAGRVTGVDAGMLRAALDSEIRVRELFKEHCMTGLTGLVPEEKLRCSDYGITGLRVEA